MADLIAEITPAEYPFEIFGGDTLLWERFLKSIDETGAEVDFDLTGYSAEMTVVAEDGSVVFTIDSTAVGYPTTDGIILNTPDLGLINLYQQVVPNVPACHQYTLRLTKTGTTTLIYGPFLIKEAIAP
jgi:hypothetical protein